MKKILMALAITAFAFYGADAKEKCCKCPAKTAHKHVVKKVKNKASLPATPRQTTASTVELCRTLPYEACKIMPDRKTVRCYKTIDPENLTPMNNEVTYYGPHGQLPGQTEKSNIETIVVTAPAKGDNCKRNTENKTTVCSYTDKAFLTRDANGNWGYRDYKNTYSYR
ncbi:MAG: hypothetical protein K0Q79_3653 [Flavipsychrobacter sp.]|jgi:hypothetical protein|nr:hypothetical protein [Flavipsychrobacter sp.]